MQSLRVITLVDHFYCSIVETRIPISNSLRMYSHSLMNMGIVFKKESLVSRLALIIETGKNISIVYHGEHVEIRNN